jgi:hypothetical protein
MRRPLTLLLAALLVLTVVPLSAAEPAPAGSLRQTVNGEIALPTRFVLGDAGRQGWPGLARRAWLCTAESNKTIAEIFDVSPATWGGAFILDNVGDATGAGDVDIFFYGDFGDCGGTAAPVTVGEFAANGPREVGVVPAGALRAVAFTHNGVDTSFRYRAWSAPIISLGGPLDLTVLRGNVVTWVNTTSDFSFVRHTPASGAPAFNSSPKVNSEMPVDGRFTHTFTTAGTFPYQTATGTGTITVVDSVE